MDAAAAVTGFSFEGFVLDLGRGSLLTRAGEEIPLRRQSFELLRLLVENAGRLLDRDTINRAIWPDVTVTDDSITQCISDIRRAIGNDAQRILKTVLRRGYLFAARVGTQRYPQTGQAAPNLALPDKPSIAVLPFQNISGDPDQEYFADGMVEDITTGLSRIRSLFVISRHSAFTYKGSAVDVRQVGRELGVRYVLEGSVRRGGNRVRVNAQLIDAETGAHVWAERYDRDLADVFAVQDEITLAVTRAIEPAVEDPNGGGHCASRQQVWEPGNPINEECGIYRSSKGRIFRGPVSSSTVHSNATRHSLPPTGDWHRRSVWKVHSPPVHSWKPCASAGRRRRRRSNSTRQMPTHTRIERSN
jgi:TolB-like protein